MNHQNSVGYKVRVIHNQIHKIMEVKKKENEGDLTGMQHWLIGFLNDHKGEDIYQKDIESAFNVSRATASNMLSVMERKELIRREPVAHDARLKKLVLMPKAEQIMAQAGKDVKELEAHLVQGLTKDDLAQLNHYLEILMQNIGVEESGFNTKCSKKHKK